MKNQKYMVAGMLAFAFIFCGCAHTDKTKINNKIWTPDYEAQFKSIFLNELKSDTDFTVAEKNKICDCIIKKYEEYYPNGLVKNIPMDVHVHITQSCVPKTAHGNISN